MPALNRQRFVGLACKSRRRVGTGARPSPDTAVRGGSRAGRAKPRGSRSGVIPAQVPTACAPVAAYSRSTRGSQSSRARALHGREGERCAPPVTGRGSTLRRRRHTHPGHSPTREPGRVPNQSTPHTKEVTHDCQVSILTSGPAHRTHARAHRGRFQRRPGPASDACPQAAAERAARSPRRWSHPPEGGLRLWPLSTPGSRSRSSAAGARSGPGSSSAVFGGTPEDAASDGSGIPKKGGHDARDVRLA